MPVVLIERMQTELDIDIVLTAYGLTESGGFATMCRPDDDPVTVATTCGRPIADFELRIGDRDEVLLRGPNVMLGYLDDPEATAATIDADGWLHTGDVGKLDAAGNLQITDRLKDMYICGGFNVYPPRWSRCSFDSTVSSTPPWSACLTSVSARWPSVCRSPAGQRPRRAGRHRLHP
ncbi:AMP-binding enzyme family protein [Mycobacterium xenopi 3993]|nr:AMP-binding enzyme family protein [Mycobacterium xenopi 3993]